MLLSPWSDLLVALTALAGSFAGAFAALVYVGRHQLLARSPVSPRDDIDLTDEERAALDCEARKAWGELLARRAVPVEAGDGMSEEDRKALSAKSLRVRSWIGEGPEPTDA